MRLELVRNRKDGEMLLKVVFEKAKNWNPEACEWFPKYSEVEDILKALMELSDKTPSFSFSELKNLLVKREQSG